MDDVNKKLEDNCNFLHEVIGEWLDDRDVVISCGRWADGAISEFMPEGRAQLLPAKYEGCFSGVRELRLPNAEHHLHVDLGRVHQISYVVAPSVCLNFRPSMEVRFLTVGPGGAPTDRWSIAVLFSGHGNREEFESAAARFATRFRKHAARQPEMVSLHVEPDVQHSAEGKAILEVFQSTFSLRDSDWPTLLSELNRKSPVAHHSREVTPICMDLLKDAVKLPGASLVIYRDRLLIEFQTELISGVYRFEEFGHVSWQIGKTSEHHCHLSLTSVDRVLFSAEPTDCQGGALNYTIWFLTSGPSGNPWRRNGYFAIVLNRPYKGEDPRMSVIQPLMDLYSAYRDRSWVNADAAFKDAWLNGPPGRPKKITGAPNAAS
jgi:hypothetical protein